MPPKAGGFRHNSDTATWCHWTRMCVCAFISGDYDCWIIGRSLHPFFHTACCGGASIVAPWKRAIFHSFLSVLSPSISIIQVINLTPCHERKSRLPFPFIALLFGFQLFLGLFLILLFFSFHCCFRLFFIISGFGRR